MSTNFSFFVLLGLLLLYSCRTHPRYDFTLDEAPTAPDYVQDKYWAALPWKTDAADMTPGELQDQQANALIDVFFLHPTTYTGQKGDKNWNGPVDDPAIWERTQEGTIQYQASIFNGIGRVFAPYYRQAHLHAYYTKDTINTQPAFDLAYDDVKAAFQYYLDNHNDGRPIIIASHSQGTTHSIRLLQEFFDGQKLQSQLVVAYIVGIPVLDTYFETLTPCQTNMDLGCYTAWRTYTRGYTPKKDNPAVVVTNPLTWTTSSNFAPASANDGAVLRPFDLILPNACNAEVSGSVLWVSKPKFKGSWLLLGKNYHAGDMNLFYLNIRTNAALRVSQFMERP
ncbi:MAG: DUF3089 domain-containing protein [Bacteroidota bacterium]